MADIEMLLEAERRGILPADKVGLLTEARKRGLIPPLEQPQTAAAIAEPATAPEVSAMTAPFAGFSKGVGNVMFGGQKLLGQGLTALGAKETGQSLVNDAARRQAQEEQNIAAYKEQHPILTGTGEFAGEVLGTAPVGGILGKAVSGVAPTLGRAIQTSGMTGGNLPTRAIGGAVTGGASAALLNSEDAMTGAGIGAAIPAVGKLAAPIRNMMRGPEQTAQMAKAVTAAREAGYVIPPSQARGSFINRLLEGTAGKISTAQNASAVNQGITNQLAAKAIGVAEDVAISPKVLDDVRKAAGGAYEAVAALPVKPAQAADTLANIPAVPGIDPKQMVFDLRKARNDATGWYNSYARTADPDSLAKAQAAKNAASKIQNSLEEYATSIGREDLVPEMVKARELIAKTWTIEKALNPVSGTIDAKKLANELKRNKPLTNELRQIAEFGSTFPKASQTPEIMGSLPQFNSADLALGAGGVAAAQYMQDPRYAALTLMRPSARMLALSPAVQNRLIQPTAAPIINQMARQQMYRAAPVLGTQ